MKRKPKFVVVVPRCKKTGNTAPAITTSVTYMSNVTLTTQDKKKAIQEAESLSRLSDFDNYIFEIKTS